MRPAETEAFAGETEIDCSTGAVTFSDAVPLMEFWVAVIVTGPPTDAPVATPMLLIVATPVFDEDHVAVVVKSCVELSE